MRLVDLLPELLGISIVICMWSSMIVSMHRCIS